MNKIISKIKKIDKYYLYIFFLSLFLLFPLIGKNYFLGDDTQYHISNIDILANMIKEFKFSKVINIAANNFGYGAGIFYPKLPHILTAIIYLIIKPFNLNVYYGIKIAHFLNIFFSAFFMYKLIYKILKNKKVAFIGSTFYVTMPYYILDLYVRDSFAESFIFVFIPLILLGIYNLILNNKKEFYLEFIIGYIGIVNSHLVLSVFYTILLIMLILINIKSIFTKEKILCLIKASIVILIFIFPFVFPMIEHKNTSLYGVFDPIVMGTTVDLLNVRRLEFDEFYKLTNRVDRLYFYINLASLIFSFIGIILVKRNVKDKNNRYFIYGVILFTLFSFFISSIHFDWKFVPELLRSIQFPWRMVSFISFGIAFLATIGFYYFKENNFIYYFIIIFCLVNASFFINLTSFKNANSFYYDYSTYSMGWNNEYLPLKTLRNMDYYKKRNQKVKVLTKSNAKTKIIKNDTPYLEFKIYNLEKGENAVLELPRIYYLGYDIKLDDKKIDYSIDKYGFIKLKVKENGVIKVKYKGTTLYRISIVCRFITIVILIYYFIKKKKNTV